MGSDWTALKRRAKGRWEAGVCAAAPGDVLEVVKVGTAGWLWAWIILEVLR